MKDGIINGAGNSRYLKSVAQFLTLYPNYEAFAQALIEGTLPVDFNGINPAGWSQQGTALNKENMLQDSTAEMLGLSGDPTVDDALSKMPALINASWTPLQEYKIAGAYTWTVPDVFGDGRSYTIGVVIIGGGGSGGAAISHATSSSSFSAAAAIGGGSGRARFLVCIVIPGEKYSIVVGAGGEEKSSSTSDSSSQSGNSGESSAFNGIVADGGDAGSAVTGSTSYCSGASGGQGSHPSTHIADTLPCGGEWEYYTSSTAYQAGQTIGVECINPFTKEILLAAGGSAKLSGHSTGVSSQYVEQAPDVFPGGSAAVLGISANATATAPLSPGCGGGGVAILGIGGSSTYTATSAAGADGAVYIYVQGVAA